MGARTPFYFYFAIVMVIMASRICCVKLRYDCFFDLVFFLPTGAAFVLAQTSAQVLQNRTGINCGAGCNLYFANVTQGVVVGGSAFFYNLPCADRSEHFLLSVGALVGCPNGDVRCVLNHSLSYKDNNKIIQMALWGVCGSPQYNLVVLPGPLE